MLSKIIANLHKGNIAIINFKDGTCGRLWKIDAEMDDILIEFFDENLKLTGEEVIEGNDEIAAFINKHVFMNDQYLNHNFVFKNRIKAFRTLVSKENDFFIREVTFDPIKKWDTTTYAHVHFSKNNRAVVKQGENQMILSKAEFNKKFEPIVHIKNFKFETK